MPTISLTRPVTAFSFSAALKTILLTGLLVGSLDILAAFVDYMIATGGKNPVLVLKYIASAAVGKPAFTGGAGIALLGLLFHFIIAYSFTFLFFWLYSKWNIVQRNAVVTGIVYGLVIWTVMNLIVVPLTSAPHIPFRPLKALKAALILIVMIGLPLSFICRSYFSRPSQRENIPGR